MFIYISREFIKRTSSSFTYNSDNTSNSWKFWHDKALPTDNEAMSEIYKYLDTNTCQTKDGRIHLAMLPFLTPFEVLEKTCNGKQMWSLQYQDVNVNHNTCKPWMAYQICNNTDHNFKDNVIPFASGHEVDISKEFQLMFWNHEKVSVLF